MNIYHAFEVYDDQDGVELYADTDAAATHRELARTLGKVAAGEGKVETILVGLVEARTVDAALDKIRAGKWVKGSVGRADGKEQEDDTVETDKGIIRFALRFLLSNLDADTEDALDEAVPALKGLSHDLEHRVKQTAKRMGATD